MSKEPLTRKRLVTLVAGLFILSGLTWYRLGATPEFVFRGETMGTTYMVRVHGPGETRGLRAEIDVVLATVNDRMSTYQGDSELSQFNTSEAGQAFALSDETFGVISQALELSEASEGAFDITVGPVVNAYGFGPSIELTLPSNEMLTEMRAYVGFGHLTLDTEENTITKDHDAVYCDLSAIAKGYGVDQVADLLASRGFENYFVEVGGEVRARGGNLSGKPYWRIGIERPVPEVREVYQVVPLTNLALATSGNYRNFSEIDGVRVSHTIDPKTLRPVTHTLLSASVLHESCALADAFATTLMVLGPEEGMAFAEAEGLRVLLLVPDADGAIVGRSSAAWDAYVSITETED